MNNQSPGAQGLTPEIDDAINRFPVILRGPTPSRLTNDIRDKLLAGYPAEFKHGYITAFTSNFQKPCDAAGYMIGHHTWPAERKNAWYAGWNLGNVERISEKWMRS
jgi:hypothetical protein